MGGMIEGMGEDRGLDLFRDPIGVRASGAGQPVDETVGPIGLIVPSDLVELLAGISHE